MTKKQGVQPGQSGGSSRPFPLFLSLAGAAIAAAALLAAFGRSTSWSIAFGDTLLVEAGLSFALSWFAYLKRDGIRIAPRRRGAAKPAESWKDRVPGMDEEPSSPLPMPGREGPQGEAYERLASAEEALRRKILGDGDDANGAGAAADKGPRAMPGGGAMMNFLVAGGILLVLALFFEYVAPALTR